MTLKMTLKKLSLFVISCFLLTSCAPPFASKKRNRPAAPTPAQSSTTSTTSPDQYKRGGPFIRFGFEKPDPGTCRAGLDWYEKQDQLQYEEQVTVRVHRAKQRVLRYDCAGRILTDKIETVVVPHANVTLRPTDLKFKARAVRLLNYDTCERTSADLGLGQIILNTAIQMTTLIPSKVSGYTSGEITIKGDDSPAVLTFQLKRGLNRIYYTYYADCTNAEIQSQYKYGNGDYDVKVCPQAGKTHHGIYNVYSDYSEEFLPGVQEIKPTIEECNVALKTSK